MCIHLYNCVSWFERVRYGYVRKCMSLLKRVTCAYVLSTAFRLCVATYMQQRTAAYPDAPDASCYATLSSLVLLSCATSQYASSSLIVCYITICNALPSCNTSSRNARGVLCKLYRSMQCITYNTFSRNACNVGHFFTAMLYRAV